MRVTLTVFDWRLSIGNFSFLLKGLIHCVVSFQGILETFAGVGYCTGPVLGGILYSVCS